MFYNLYSSSSSFIELGQVGIKSSAVEILPTNRMALVMLGRMSKLCSPPVLSLVARLKGCSPLVLLCRQLKNVTNDGAVVTSLNL